MNRTPVASLPAYQWPEQWVTRRRYAPWRWLVAAAFHGARLAGVTTSFVAPRPRAIAVLRTDGVGDAILFEPALRSLARRFDGHEVHLWAPKPTCELFESHPVVSRRVVVPRGFKSGNHAVFWSIALRARLGWAIGRNHYAAAVYPASDPEPLGNWLIASIRAGERWIVDGSTLNQFDWQRNLTEKSVSSVLSIELKDRHELNRNADLAEIWGSPIPAQARPDLPLSSRATTYAGVEIGAARHAARRNRARGLIGVVVTGSSPINRYPPEKWVAALRSIWNDHRLMPALLGGPTDAETVESIRRRLVEAGMAHHVFPPTQDIAIAAAIVGKLDALLSVDTGLAHAGAAMDIPTAVLVSGGMPGRFWPWPMPTRSIVLTRKTPCAGCNYRCTQPDVVCLTEIDPQQIAAAVGRIIKPARNMTIAPKEYRHAG
jgi:ADP-heptose:LPS heptosyltransferase